MNSLGILTIATLIAAAITMRYFWLDLEREKRRNARLRRDIKRYLDDLDEATLLIDELVTAQIKQRHPAHARPQLAVIDGGAQ